MSPDDASKKTAKPELFRDGKLTEQGEAVVRAVLKQQEKSESRYVLLQPVAEELAAQGLNVSVGEIFDTMQEYQKLLKAQTPAAKNAAMWEAHAVLMIGREKYDRMKEFDEGRM